MHAVVSERNFQSGRVAIKKREKKRACFPEL